MAGRLLSHAESHDYLRRMLGLAADILSDRTPNLKEKAMSATDIRNAVAGATAALLRDPFTPGEDCSSTNLARKVFEEMQASIPGRNCFERIVRPDGSWKYFDSAMNSRWQGWQMAMRFYFPMHIPV